MNWSERQEHRAGTLAKALLEHYVRKGWLQANQDGRALRTTAAGERNLLSIVGP